MVKRNVEGVNLLDAGSSDDEQEHFSIPPALRLNIHEEGPRYSCLSDIILIGISRVYRDRGR